MKKKKLLIIGSTQGVYGGIEAFMIAVAEAAAHWPEFDVTLCFKLVSGVAADDKLTTMAAKYCSNVNFVHKGSSELMRLIKDADIIHAQNMPPDIVIPAFLRRKKIFLTVHNKQMPGFNLHKLIWKFTIRLADKRWFNSNFVWNTWEPGKKSANSACIPTVCKLPAVTYPPGERKGFLFVGRWIKNKGIEELIKAYAIAGIDKEKWPLTILGDGPLKSEIYKLAADNKVNAFMPGFIDDKTKQEYMAKAKWLAAPANTGEDLGLTPIEARSIGVPVIVTRDGGLPEAGGPYALIAEPGNVEDLAGCIKTAVDMDEAEYIKRSELGYEQLRSFLKPIEFYREAFLAG